MNEAATMLNGEARRAASILHQTPGWRWRRKLCLTERSQRRQSGPTTKAWRRLPTRQRHDACETPSEHLRETVPKLERNACRRGNVGRVRGIVRARAESTARAALKGCRVRVAPPGACGLHRQNKIHAGVDSIVSKSLADNGVATPRDMRAAPPGDAPPGSDTWTSADSPIEAGPSYRSCTASPQRRRGVTVPSLIETICELLMTRTYREAQSSLTASSLVCTQSERV